MAKRGVGMAGWGLLGCVLGFGGCSGGGVTGAERFEFRQIHMGVEAVVVVYASDERAARGHARAAFDRIAHLDGVMSDYRQDSELSRLCEGSRGEWREVSGDLFEVLALSRGFSERTGGMFDATLGALTGLWRESRKSGRLAGEEELAAARARSGWMLLGLDEATSSVRLGAAGMRLDLGGIGKGYAAQEAVEVLRERGVERAMVALAGDVVASGPPPGREGWRVAIATGEGEDGAFVMLANAAVSTSGDAAQFVEIGGERYAHIIDPATGLGVRDPIAATVVAATGAEADALATASCVAGGERAAGFLGLSPGVEARLVTREGVVRVGGSGRRRIR